MTLVALGVMTSLALLSTPAEAATTFNVTETGDDYDIDLSNARCDTSTDAGDQCTLRAAIEEANDTAGADTIDFDIGAGTGAKTISPTSGLPTITDAVAIDGYTQAGASENTLEEGNDTDLKVQLDGSGAGVDAIGLRIDASDCTIEGLVIKNFNAFGVLIEGARATGNRVKGNFVGVSRDGTIDRGNGIGVYVVGEANTVGGTQPEGRNVISGNDQSGVQIADTGAMDNEVKGNYIGPSADGTADLGNGYGVVIDANDNTVGGTAPGAGNVISGNNSYGVYITTEATDNKLEGNYVGTTADGDGGLGNDSHGMYVAGDSNTIGGTVSGAGNVISGNDGYGVFISGVSGGNENRVEGNSIGTTADGTGDLGNVRGGVTLQNGPDFTAVGGTLPGAANRIAHNGENGVSVVDTSDVTGSDAEGNYILSNAIFDNGGLGIDLEGGTEDADGVTSNDTGDLDTGPNNLQNFPVKIRATRSNSTGRTTISGRLNSNPAQDFLIQCFLTGEANASDHGEGSRLLDTEFVSTDADGKVGFTCDSPRSLLSQLPGQTVSATATNVLTADTSEFSKNVSVTTGP